MASSRVRRKAAYLALSESTELEFEHYLAVKLGRTVGELRRSMSHAEFLRWNMYYARIAQEAELERLKRGG